MNKRNKHCRSCLHYIPCKVNHSIPAMGECTSPVTGDRESILKEMRSILLKKETAYLKKTISVEADFLGTPVRINVRKIKRITGSLPQLLEFIVGKDENGIEYTTTSIDTNDLIQIMKAL